ncbi:hypothetical protein LGM71_30650 [Burkholderia sp. AU33545]|uniref:hypothetical protein n=1 Tax=Burkholderia TaxID=32008 RepID=UPI001CF29175|nr:hypothetical protein [Burkholderia sp. AU33545]MCA8205396.1 hypothetical protein [Burkholderia sp. AU33545]
MRDGTRPCLECGQEELFVKFATFAHASGCKTVFVFSAESNIVEDPRDFEFSARQFFYHASLQERASFDLHLAGASDGGWFEWVGVKDEFDSTVVAEAVAWLLEVRKCHVTPVDLPLSD